jgi:hypothetical protein
MTILAEIPEIISPADEQADRKKMAFGWTLAALIVVIILAGSAFSYLHG